MAAVAEVAPTRRRLKVLFVTTWYPSKRSPVEGVFVREHAKAVSLYDDVVVLHLAGDDAVARGLWRLEEEADRSLTEGIPTYRVRWRRSRVPHTTYPLALWSAVCAWRRLARSGVSSDVIHAHIHTAGPSAIIMAKLGGIPLVISEHSSAFPRRLLSRFAARAARWSFESADAVLPVSRALRSAIEEMGVRARFEIVPNVVDTGLFHPGPGRRTAEEKTILFVGLLNAPVKGVPILLRAAALLRKRPSVWKLRIVGDGPLRPEYERVAAALGLTDRVVFAGRKSKAEVAEEMRHADVLVLPSLWENLPCVLIEGQASGLPAVASRVGGIPEIVTDETGRLVPAGDVEALAEALEATLEGNPIFDREAIRGASKRYAPDVVGLQIHEIYESVCDDRPDGASRHAARNLEA